MSATSDREIAELDKSLAIDGEDIVLRRVVGTTNQVNIDVGCRAFVRFLQAEELVGSLIQSDMKVILSPTEITRAQWPGGQPVSSAPHQSDPRVPRNSDKIVVQGKVRMVSFPKPILVDGVLVRIELLATG